MSLRDESQLDQDFLSAARKYKQAVEQTTSPTSLRQLWHDTNLPYRIASTDPHSDAYRDEVRAVYRSLTTREYDVGSELTSTKQDDAQFQLGYPWTAGDLGIVAAEMSKAVQAMRALHQVGAQGRVIEFGAGWGNLALPLAKAGFAVTAVDIDSGFTRRLQRLAASQDTSIVTFDGTFVDAATTLHCQFETVIFQSSFHHCISFEDLLTNITGRILAANGRILFLSEPILSNLNFPWGIRYDGEALWAVMCHGWLELGFHEDFFIDLLFRHGLLPVKVPGLNGLVGEGWCATRAEEGILFGHLALASCYESGFHPAAGDIAWGRFCRQRARLPGNGTKCCMLQIKNFGPKSLSVEFRSAACVERITFGPSENRAVIIPTENSDIEILGEVFVPDRLMSNGDMREISVSILEASWHKV